MDANLQQTRPTAMEVLGATVVASLAYIVAPVARILLARRFRVSSAAMPSQDGMKYWPTHVEPVELPPAVARWCDAESEEFAREEARQVARRLYAEHGDWNTVLQSLEQAS